MPAIKKPKIGTKPANGSKAKDIISRRRNSAAKVTAARRTSRSATKKVSKCSEDDDVEDDEPSYEPSEDEIDGDSAEGDSVARPTKGKKVVAKLAEKMTYKKNLRRDATKFTTSQAMIDAEDEFDPRAAAYRGKATDGGGNGRKKGRRLIRWTAQADQLLLLCLHHELARNKEELPYEAIAQRMFPEKNATGGAIKERFAKLRIECLNRGSWVPPILGKTPQNTRPDVRGVVRLAPGIDRGRFVLWKEDASKLIDPKDINKGHVDAQKKGLQYPERVWISPGAEKEYLKLMNAHKALNLSPIPGPIPTDDDELLSDVDEDEIEAVSDGGVAGPTPKKRKAAAITDSSKKKPRAVAHNTPKKIAAKGRATQADDSDYEGTTAGAGSRKPLPNRPDAGQFKSPVSRPRSRVVTPTVEAPDSDSDAINTESSDESDDEDSPANSRLMMMAFDKDEEVRPLRSIVIVRGITPGALSKYPAGIQGPGDDDYGDDDVAENPAVQRDRNGSLTDEDNQAVVLDKPETQFVDGPGGVEHDGSTVEQHFNAQDLLRAMKRNTDNNGQVINKGLWEIHVQHMNALNGGGIVRNPPQAQVYPQTQIPQYGHQMQNEFAFHGLDPFSGGFGGLQVGFGDYGRDSVVFGDFGFPAVQLAPVSQCGTQEKLSQHNTKNFVENSLINATKYQMAKEVGSKSNANVKPDPTSAEFSGLDATLAPAPEDEFFSFGEYGTNGGAVFDDSFGAV